MQNEQKFWEGADFFHQKFFFWVVRLPPQPDPEEGVQSRHSQVLPGHLELGHGRRRAGGTSHRLPQAQVRRPGQTGGAKHFSSISLAPPTSSFACCDARACLAFVSACPPTARTRSASSCRSRRWITDWTLSCSSIALRRFAGPPPPR